MLRLSTHRPRPDDASRAQRKGKPWETLGQQSRGPTSSIEDMAAGPSKEPKAMSPDRARRCRSRDLRALSARSRKPSTASHRGNLIPALLRWSLAGLVLLGPARSALPAPFCEVSTIAAIGEQEWSTGAAASGRLLALTGTTPSGVAVYDAADPFGPRLLAAEQLDQPPQYVELNEALLLVATTTQVVIFDVSCPERPQRLSTVSFDGTTPIWIGWGSGVAYVQTLPTEGSAISAGFHVVDLRTPNAPARIGFVPFGYASRPTVHGGFAYLTTVDGLAVLDVRHPADPRIVTTLEIFGTAVAATETHLYVADASTIRSFDRRDAGNPVFLGRLGVDLGPFVVALYPFGERLVALGQARDVPVIDILDPTQMRVVGHVPTTQLKAALARIRDAIYLANGPNRTVILDTAQCPFWSRTLPVVANAAGREGAWFVTDLSITNDGPRTEKIVFGFDERNAATPETHASVVIEPGKTSVIADVLGTTFGRSGAGPLFIYAGDNLRFLSRMREVSSGLTARIPPVTKLLLSNHDYVVANLGMVTGARLNLSASNLTAVKKVLTVHSGPERDACGASTTLEVPGDSTVLLSLDQDECNTPVTSLSLTADGPGLIVLVSETALSEHEFAVHLPEVTRELLPPDTTCLRRGSAHATE